MKKIILLLLFIVPFVTQANTGDGLLTYWTMDTRDQLWSSDTVGYLFDRSFNVATGTFNGMSKAVSQTNVGRIFSSLFFDGTNDYISNANNLNLTGDYSASVWFNKDPSNVSKRLVQLGDSTNAIYSQIAVNPLAEKSVHCVQNTLSGGQSVAIFANATDSAWHNVVCVWNGGTITKMFVDGVETTTAAGLGLWAIDAHTGIKVGTRGTLATFFKGYIDDFRLYNRALTGAEAQQLYRIGLIRFNQ